MVAAFTIGDNKRTLADEQLEVAFREALAAGIDLLGKHELARRMNTSVGTVTRLSRRPMFGAPYLSALMAALEWEVVLQPRRR